MNRTATVAARGTVALAAVAATTLAAPSSASAYADPQLRLVNSCSQGVHVWVSWSGYKRDFTIPAKSSKTLKAPQSTNISVQSQYYKGTVYIPAPIKVDRYVCR